MAIARLASADDDFVPNHIRVANARIEPPARRVTQIEVSSGIRPYKEDTKYGKNVQDPPKKMAKKMLTMKRLRNFILPQVSCNLL